MVYQRKYVPWFITPASHPCGRTMPHLAKARAGVSATKKLTTQKKPTNNVGRETANPTHKIGCVRMESTKKRQLSTGFPHLPNAKMKRPKRLSISRTIGL